MRHAIYICPPHGSPLERAAAAWLGRDAFTGEALRQRKVPGLENGLSELTASPRRYGFHGTLVAPFRPAPGVETSDISVALREFCRDEDAFEVPVAIGRLGPFFALVASEKSLELATLANRAVKRFHRFRAEPSAEETARRRPERLTTRQREMLEKWHYPYVFDEFRFHMTLTGPVSDTDAPQVAHALLDHFGDVLDEPLVVDALARYEEPKPGDFTVAERVEFVG